MTEYKVLESGSASTLDSIVNIHARDGWIVSFFSSSTSNNQYSQYKVFSVVMERETK